MTVSRHEAAIAALHSPDQQEQTRAVRFIKNNVIGNRTKKELYLGMGVAERLVDLLSTTTHDTDLRAQVAVVLGSFAYGNDENINILVTAGAIAPLLGTIAENELKLVEAGARALKAIFQSANAPREEVLQGTHVQNLIRLLTPTPPSIDAMNIRRQQHNVPVRISEVAAGILAKISVTREEQTRIAQAGAIPLLIDLLDIRWSSYPKVQEAALDALSNLSRENAAIAQTIVSTKSSDTGERSILLMLRLVRDKRPVMRLLAATCLTNIYRTGSLPSEHQQDTMLTLLPTLIKLFNETAPISTLYGSGWATVQEKAPKVFADLVEPSEELQKAALEADAIGKLAAVIIGNGGHAVAEASEGKYKGKKEVKRPSKQVTPAPAIVSTCGHAERVKEGALRAIAAVCALREECRKQVIEAKLLPHIVTAMSHPSIRIRIAACECTRSLSRSVKNLRTCLVDAGINMPLFKLLSDDSDQVQITACATLCNIVLDFSPMKKTVLENGGVERLVDLTKSMDDRLRLNAVWALKNLLFQADSGIKERVMEELTWPGLISLINDGETGIQEQALNLLRNLACGKEGDIEQVFVGLGEDQLLTILESKLTRSAQHDDIVLQALYVIVNVSTGNDKHKAAIMDREGVLQSILGFMSHPKSLIRVATIWSIINLTWTDDPGSQDRVTRLRALGFQDRLQSMTEDLNMDVKDRVKTALANFGIGPGAGNGVVPMDVEGSAAGSSNNNGGRSRRSGRDRERDRDRERERERTGDFTTGFLFGNFGGGGI